MIPLDPVAHGLKVINSLNPNKSTGPDGIGNRLLKMACPYICRPLADIFNFSLNSGTFPNEWRRANVTPVFKKEDKTALKNYRPVSVLPTVSKIFERLIQKQLHLYIDQYLSPHLCGYRKGFSTQTAILHLLEKRKETRTQ